MTNMRSLVELSKIRVNNNQGFVVVFIEANEGVCLLSLLHV